MFNRGQIWLSCWSGKLLNIIKNKLSSMGTLLVYITLVKLHISLPAVEIVAKWVEQCPEYTVQKWVSIVTYGATQHDARERQLLWKMSLPRFTFHYVWMYKPFSLLNVSGCHLTLQVTSVEMCMMVLQHFKV